MKNTITADDSEFAFGPEDRTDLQTPNTYVFYGVQVLGIVWYMWFWVKQVFTDDAIPLIPFVLLHALIVLHVMRGMWFVTVWRHRYFSHRLFEVRDWLKRLGIVPFAALNCAGDGQRGVCLWADQHRHHHKHSDTPKDGHTCKKGSRDGKKTWKGINWCHWGWVVALREKRQINWSAIPDLSRSPSLRWIENNQWLGILLVGAAFCSLGAWLKVGGYETWFKNFWFSLGAHFFTLTILYHLTFSINSLMHLIGEQKYPTGDESRNHWLLALLTGGEGWHNNHHRDFPRPDVYHEVKSYFRSDLSERYWQAETSGQKCLDWFGLSIWLLIKLRFLRKVGVT